MPGTVSSHPPQYRNPPLIFPSSLPIFTGLSVALIILKVQIAAPVVGVGLAVQTLFIFV